MGIPIPPAAISPVVMYEFATALAEKIIIGIKKFDPSSYDSLFNRFLIAASGWFEVKEIKTWDWMLSPFVNSGLLTKTDADNLKGMKDAVPPWDWVALLVVFIQLVSHFMQTTIEANSARMSQAINKQARSMLPSPEAAISAAFIAPEKTGQVREILARLGLSEENIDLMFLANYARTDLGTLQLLWWREEITDEILYERMRELGFTDTRIKEIVKGWSLIPPVQDILTMVAHEAFEPDAIALMGLDREFPEEQSEWLSKQGLSPYWQRKYWIAHWQQPSIQMGYEMLQRKVIGLEELDMLFRTVEIPQYWREKLVKIAYQPYTRVDVRRMYALGVLKDEDLVKAYTDIAYDQAHAENMAVFTKRLTTEKDRALTKGEIIKGYVNKLMSKTDCKDLLIQLHYTADEADYFISLEDYKEINSLQSLLLANIQGRFTKALISRSEASNKLDMLNLPAARRDALLEKWDVDVMVDQKVPSKSDLDEFYVADIISGDTYRLELKRLGYNFQYIEWYNKMADVVKKKKAPAVAQTK